MLDRSILIPVALVVQAILVGVSSGREHPPPMVDLAKFPARIGDWNKAADQEIPAEVRDQLHADQILARMYAQPSTGTYAELLTAWFQSQRGGKTQPHSPKVCLPGAGFTQLESGVIRIDTAAGTIAVNRYVMASTAGQKAVVMYWYQTPRRVVAGEWESKFWLIPDAIHDRRTDTALVRVIVWAGDGDVARAGDRAVKFSSDVYPMLREALPHL